ncbi:MAG: chromosome segregation protein SMC [Lachnospiraceae bacterium]|nr:chromosome segregation protein SMC [Lachnospiraceae bacterium]
MYLKSIEVHGFKSFANKIVFDFHNGITGIVGPNGSGKSNVADAVRWVLGEQRVKQLRGSNMQDVIFSGTETRKPQGYAFVAITLDNADKQLPVDYEEVTVARRLYRSGESEYLINGTVCRLKDVQEMFYDTGIGKEGYSIIGQGQIDKILSTKPEEARELFDEATGIVKFKKRKKNAEKKLEEEKQNLLRVNDILTELEKQLGPLKRQSETAKEYLKKRDTLKIYDVNLFLMEMERIKQAQKDLEEKTIIVQNDFEDSKKSYENCKLEYEHIEKEIEGLNEGIEEKKTLLTENALQKKQYEGQIAVLKAQNNSALSNDKHLKSRKEAILRETEEKESQKEEFLKEKYKLDMQLADMKGVLAEAEENLESVQQRILDLNHSIEYCKNEIIQLLNEKASTKGKIQRYDTMLEQVQIRKAEVSSKILSLKTEENENESGLAEAKREFEEVNSVIRGYNEQKTVIEQEIEDYVKSLRELNHLLEVGQSAYHREASRLESLRNLTERYDGYGNSIRKVMEQKKNQSGILGVVADLIKVEKNYEVAIETALGGSIQNIVTDNEQTAKSMIQYLKANKLGRATFLPLTSIKGNNIFNKENVLKETGVIGVAHTLVKTEEKFSVLAKYLLGRTLVVDHIDNAIRLQKKYDQTLRIVTLEGESLNPGGSMTGGAFKNNSNLLGRRREIEELELSVKQLSIELEERKAQVEDTKAKRTACYGTLDEINEKLSKEFVKQNTAKMQLNLYEQKKQEFEGSLNKLRSELKELEGQIQDIITSRKEIAAELKGSDIKEKANEVSIARYQEELVEYQEKEVDCKEEVEELHLQNASFQQKKEFVQENIRRIEEELHRLKEEKESLDETIAHSRDDAEAREEGIATLQGQIEELTGISEKTEQEKTALLEKKEELLSKNKDFFDKREQLSGRINDLDKELYRLGTQKEKLEESAENFINYMWQEYELTHHEALPMKDEQFSDRQELKRSIAKIKEEIKQLGNVNINAIEDYKEISERYEFMNKQRNDLVEAEDMLKNIISELDEGMKRQFTEMFAKIQVEFDKAFKELFGGGKGTLELIDPEDILETGVRIISQPPGKKLQNMMQLSGGEKALTAIALLFAIQNLKPSPFCLLDEIEAALDDSNVGRFANYLHKLTKNTQFIVITHRRGTMAAADRLYGITMQEKGVSALVSVNLIEEELDK